MPSNSPYAFSLDRKGAFALFPFILEGKPLEESRAVCGISTYSAGSMRFRWNEDNKNRKLFFEKANINFENVVPLELIHSKIIYIVEKKEDVYQKQGDGILTANPELVPSVTVADCMPIYLYDTENNVTGMLHSGWKGTGICVEAVSLMIKHYNSKPEKICAVVGPHIDRCCYNVDKERADYFKLNFSSESVCESQKDGEKVYSLSLLNANLFLLEKSGILPENTAYCVDCTCCSPFLGSHRRESAGMPDNMPPEERSKCFTPMAAFVIQNYFFASSAVVVTIPARF